MKAWRNPKNQARFRKEAGDALRDNIIQQGGRPTQAQHDMARWLKFGRVGKALRDQQYKILPFPSFLVQALLIRGGWMQAG